MRWSESFSNLASNVSEVYNRILVPESDTEKKRWGYPSLGGHAGAIRQCDLSHIKTGSYAKEAFSNDSAPHQSSKTSIQKWSG